MIHKTMIYNHPLIKIFNSTLLSLPTPMNISFNWNFGSLLGFTLMIQILSGLLMSLHYTPDLNLAFKSLFMTYQNINLSWLIQYIHSNGASLFFFLIFLHIGRNLYYNSFKNSQTWMSGVLLLLLLMATAFLGYVLPWGQMSFWGASVITNLITAIPLLGQDIVTWIWGGFSINNPTLKRFFSLHFLFPFIILAVMMIHLLFLHQTGSSNPLGIPTNMSKISFHPFFSLKDIFGVMLMVSTFLMIILTSPLILNDPENFNQANTLVTPIHIQPEWYFLFAYAILRSIPNKLGGVIFLMLAILIIMLPIIMHNSLILTFKFNPIKKFLSWSFITSFFILTWIGANPVENPLIYIGQITSIMYFSIFIIMYL